MLQEIYQRYKTELFDSVVPFWLRHSLDHRYGGYFTCLDRDGAVFDTRKYIWLQGRAVWMFSKLYSEIERRDEWLAAAAQGVEFLRQNAFDAQGRCYFSLTRDGRPVAFQRKPYSAVFVAMGLLEYSTVTADQKIHEQAVSLIWKIRDWIGNGAALGRPVLAGSEEVSKLADVMVMIMLLLELLRTRENALYLEVLGEYMAAARRHLLAERRVLMEHVSLQGEFFLQSPDGRLFNPGHSIEMCWFLLLALRWRPDERLQEEVLDTLRSSLELGWDWDFGGLYYFMDIEARPPLALEHNMKLWWPHTEALYAVILAYSITQDAIWLDWLQRIDAYCFTHFVDNACGEWFGYCDRRGNLSSNCKGNHYKGFFHVPRALLYSVQEIDRFTSYVAAGEAS